MNFQILTLIVPIVSLLSSLLVVIITSASNIWAKKIDVEQKQQDRDQELRKLYLTRKIEVSEKIIQRRVKIVNYLELMRYKYKRFMTDRGYFDREFNNMLDEVNSFYKSDRSESSAYMLFFDRKEIQEKGTQELTDRFNQAAQDVIILFQERAHYTKASEDEQNIDDWSEIAQIVEAKELELKEKLENYLLFSKEFTDSLLKTCEEIRNNMKKYDLT